MDDTIISFIVAWIPIVGILWIFGHFVMKLVKVQKKSVAALERIADQLEQIGRRPPTS